MEFMDRIKFLRTKSNMTQSQLAVIVGKGEGAVRAWETGRAKPDVDTLIKLADYFNVSTDYLVGRTEVVVGDESASDLTEDEKKVYTRLLNISNELLYEMTQIIYLIGDKEKRKIVTECVYNCIQSIYNVVSQSMHLIAPNDGEDDEIDGDDIYEYLDEYPLFTSGIVRDSVKKMGLYIASIALEKPTNIDNDEKIYILKMLDRYAK